MTFSTKSALTAAAVAMSHCPRANQAMQVRTDVRGGKKKRNHALAVRTDVRGGAKRRRR